MTFDDLGSLIEVMIQDYETYNERNASCVVASPDIVKYLLAKIPNHYITIDATGTYYIAGIKLLADPNINRGKIEIQ